MIPGEMRKEVDIVIVNWNAGDLLYSAVEPLMRPSIQCDSIVANVFVVDNASTDGSQNKVLAAFPSVGMVHNTFNQGFARACNQGAAEGSADYILFLNPDAALQPSELRAMLEFMAEPVSSNIAVLGPQVRNASGNVERTCARSPLLRHFLCRAFGLHQILSSKYADFAMREFDHLSSLHVDQVIGACILTRRAVFEALGGFDERFFVYFEEVDYCRRVRESGWRVYFRSENYVTHVGNGTTDRVKGFRFYLSLRSRMTYAHKWFTRRSALFVDITSLLIEPLIRTIFVVSTGRMRDVGDVLDGAQRLWKWRLGSQLTQSSTVRLDDRETGRE